MKIIGNSFVVNRLLNVSTRSIEKVVMLAGAVVHVAVVGGVCAASGMAQAATTANANENAPNFFKSDVICVSSVDLMSCLVSGYNSKSLDALHLGRFQSKKGSPNAGSRSVHIAFRILSHLFSSSCQK